MRPAGGLSPPLPGGPCWAGAEIHTRGAPSVGSSPHPLCAPSLSGLRLQGALTPTTTISGTVGGPFVVGGGPGSRSISCPCVMLCLCPLMESSLHPLVEKDAGPGGPAAVATQRSWGWSRSVSQGARGTFRPRCLRGWCQDRVRVEPCGICSGGGVRPPGPHPVPAPRQGGQQHRTCDQPSALGVVGFLGERPTVWGQLWPSGSSR